MLSVGQEAAIASPVDSATFSLLLVNDIYKAGDTNAGAAFQSS
jgi:hypothetical protein